MQRHQPRPDTPLTRFSRPVSEFIHAETSGGVLLLTASVLAIVLANSPWARAYAAVWHTPVTLGLGSHQISHPLEFWINDGLMAVFFFVVGLEIKRELLLGHLSSPRLAALPVIAGAGGMLVPAAVYAALNAGGEGSRGWGVPMATDIAFVLGVLALLGSRAPTSLKVFLTALAIVDDLGAVLVIAIFYSGGINWAALGVAGLLLATLAAANVLGVRRPLPYALLGIGLWAATIESGVHASVAGVLIALAIPARARIDTGRFLQKCRHILQNFEAAGPSREDEPTNEDHHSAIGALEDASEDVQSPLQRLERMLHPWVAFGIMPLFALANAGVPLGSGGAAGSGTGGLSSSVTLGIFLGLFVGKPVGIALFTWAAVRLGAAALPGDLNWKHVVGGAVLGGIGFTMSLFVAALAFNSPDLLQQAKLGILAASVVAGVTGWLLLSRLGPRVPDGEPSAVQAHGETR